MTQIKNRANNMNWFEFLETKKEDLLFIKTELAHIKTLIEWLVLQESAARELRDLEKRTHIFIQQCEKLESKPVDQLYSESKRSSDLEKDVEFYASREREINSLMKGLSFLSNAVEQRLTGSEISQSTYLLPTQSLSSEFPGLHRAAGCVLSDLFDLINGEEWSNQPTEPLPLVVFREGGYSVFTDIRVAIIPIEDKSRLRFWVGLGHEAFHEKVGSLFRNVLLASEGKESAIRELEMQPTRISESDRKFIKDTIDSMIDVIGKVFAYEPKHPSANIDDQINGFFRSQVEEIFCDIGATVLAGPADFLASSSQWVLSYRNSLYGFYKSLDGFSHPPDYVRLRYMLDILRGLDYPRDDIDSWGERLEEIRLEEQRRVKEDSAYDPQCWVPGISKTYENYSRIIREQYLDRIGKILDFLLVERNVYDGEKWKALKEDYQLFMEDGSIPETASSIDLMNMAWLKREEVYEKVGAKGGLVAFGEWHKRERKLYENAICFLSARYSEKICRIDGDE